MDNRQALVYRNQQMAQAFHQAPMRHLLRRRLIRMVSHVPFTMLDGRHERILFIKPDHIGDVLLATPAICAVKEAMPLTEIHVLAGSWSADILANYTAIDQVLTVDFPGFNRQGGNQNLLKPYQQLVKVSRQLRAIGYKSVVILRPDHWWGALLAYMAGIPQRIGYALDDVASFLTDAVAYEGGHVVLQAMRLVEAWTGMPEPQAIRLDLPLDEASEANVDALLSNVHLGKDDKLLCIHAGAGTWVKQWDVAKWATVADTLIEQLGVRVIFTGGDGERALVTHIQNQMRHKSITMAGELRLMELASLYARCEAVLGVDSGPMHIASAVHTPTVTLFGPADPAEFGTWGDANRHRILTSGIGCRPCRVLDWGDDAPSNHPCVQDISVGALLEETRRVIQYRREQD